MSDNEKIHPFLQHPTPPKPPPDPETLIAVLQWECPHCKHRNPFDDRMDGEVVPCMQCGGLARPNSRSLTEATTTGQLANIRKLLDF